MGRLQHLDDFKNPRYRLPLEQDYSQVSHVKAVKKSSGVPLWSIITIAFVIIGVVFCVLMVVDSREQSKPENTTINTTEKSLLHNGLNTFSGRFRYNGADYGFILTLNYNSSTKVITDATYEPTSYYGPLKLTNASISGNILYLSNSSTNITVSSANGSNVFEGTMRRGDLTAHADWSYNNKQLLKPIQMNRFVRLGGGDGQMAESWGRRRTICPGPVV